MEGILSGSGLGIRSSKSLLDALKLSGDLLCRLLQVAVLVQLALHHREGLGCPLVEPGGRIHCSQVPLQRVKLLTRRPCCLSRDIMKGGLGRSGEPLGVLRVLLERSQLLQLSPDQRQGL